MKDCLYNEKYKIYFESRAIKDCFDQLLKYECQECLKANKQRLLKKANSEKQTKNEQPKTAKPEQSVANSKEEPSGVDDEAKCEKRHSALEKFEDDTQGLLKPLDVKQSSFSDVFGLTNHLRYVHRLKLCDLCLTHNKLFPFEYSYYTIQALRRHIEEGEPNTSHRGHPSCALCQNTFFNTDELISHMSREHFHCHLCGRHDSNMRIYFLDYTGLREHFKTKHYLCERDNCRHEQLTSAFDSNNEYQLHLIEVHGNPTSGMSRGEARQQRTITLDSASYRTRDSSPNRSLHRNLPPNAAVVSTGTVATANSQRHQRPESIQVQLRPQRIPSRAEFPVLGHSVATPTQTSVQPVPSSYTSNYPSLVQARGAQHVSPSSTLSQRMVAGPSQPRTFVRTLGGGSRAPDELNEMDFPPLPEQPKAKAKKSEREKTSLGSKNDHGALTLDQLISSNLTLSNRNNGLNKRKGNTSKSNKSVKQRVIKFQLS